MKSQINKAKIKRGKTLHYIFILAVFTSIISLSSSAEGNGIPGVQLYDDFYQGRIDRTKWQRQEAERGIKSGAVESSFTQYGSARSFWLEFNDPDAKNSIQTDITVTEISNDGAALMARIGGHFYNSIYGDLNPGHGEQGEIWVQIGVRDSGAGLFAYYSIGRCEDALCNEFTTLIWNDTDFGSVDLGDTDTFSVVWNWNGSNPATNTFTFGFDGTPVTTSDPLPPVMGPSKARFKGIGVRVDGIDSPDEGGTITARFDDVRVGGALYDDFSATDGLIDSTKWRSGEFVRRVNNGVLESAVARWNRNGDNHMNFSDVNAITAFQADVTVKEVINVGASPIARLSSAFYNDGTPGEGRRGDVLAGAQIYHDGSQLRGSCWVTRCTQINCNVPGEYENLWWDNLSPDAILFDETHTLSISWDASENKFYFGFDGSIITPNVDFPNAVATPRGGPFNGIGTRVHGIGDDSTPPFEGEGGYIRAEFDNVFLLIDILSPFASLQEPANGATNVPLNTNIVIQLQDGGTGVDQSTVLMMVNDILVYDGANPGDYPHTTPSGSPSDYFLTYDPPDDFNNAQEVTVAVSASDVAGNAMVPAEYSFITEPEIGDPWDSQDDDDQDGIPNGVEADLGTSPNMKTLFVRPKKRTGFSSYEYWDGFIALFPWAGRPGFADIPPFTNAGIEISVIGDLNNPYPPMRAFNYDPATDGNHPPCDILEVVYMRDTDDCDYSPADNEGHTFFTGGTWSWDTKGYTPHNSGTAHYLKYGYFTAQVYPYPLANYFEEGAYNSIAPGQSPILSASSCTYDQCWEFDHSSPLNLNAVDPVNGLPDGTAEFNVITYLGNGAIQSMGPLGIGYDSPSVLKRTVIHEMGHGLLFALNDGDHCDDFECIMFHSTKDWELHSFGSPSGCVHSPGGSRDIRAVGIVHNSFHVP